jgi:hypothetical protein
MSRGFFIGMMVLFIWACSPVKEASKNSVTLAKNSEDSTEYKILIIDPHFDQWYLLNFNEAKDHSIEYYRTNNMTAVVTWNNYFRTGQYGEVIDSYIEYWPDVDYGIEVNRKLYWYFKYIESNYGIRLLW